MRGQSFPFDSMEEKLVAYPSQEMTTNIWKKRLGHSHQRSLIYMMKKDIVRGIPLWRMNTQLGAHDNWESKVGCLLPRQTGEHQ